MKTTALIIVIAVMAVLGVLLIIMEKQKCDAKYAVLIAVMTGLSVAGRFIFAAFPGFKPVTAIIIICGMNLGCQAGFFCGSLTALISNFYFGQGPWTPFQMLIWGAIGILAGVMSQTLKKERVILILYGILSGIIFSLFMDVYTVFWTLGRWSVKFYIAAVMGSSWYTFVYAVSNVIFLLALSRPLTLKIDRIINKYKIKE